jgi:hypothetical protein
MTATIAPPAERVKVCASVFRAANLQAYTKFNDHVGYHAEVSVDGKKPGRYIVTPAHSNQFKVRWFPSIGRTVVLGCSETAARAAGLILDHQLDLLP